MNTPLYQIRKKKKSSFLWILDLCKLVYIFIKNVLMFFEILKIPEYVPSSRELFFVNERNKFQATFWKDAFPDEIKKNHFTFRNWFFKTTTRIQKSKCHPVYLEKELNQQQLNDGIDSIFYNPEEIKKELLNLENPKPKEKEHFMIELENKFKHFICIIHIPEIGNIAMYYNIITYSFCYYCDTQAIPGQ